MMIKVCMVMEALWCMSIFPLSTFQTLIKLEIVEKTHYKRIFFWIINSFEPQKKFYFALEGI